MSLVEYVRLGVKSAWPFPAKEPIKTFPQAQAGKLQPVWVEDVARCFVDGLTNDKTIDEVYPIGGPDEYTWPKLYSTFRQYLRNPVNKPILAIPQCCAKLVAGLPFVPFNRDQVIMSQENSTCDIQKVQSDFAIELAPFESTLAAYAAEI